MYHKKEPVLHHRSRYASHLCRIDPWSIYWVHFAGEKSCLFAELFNRTSHIDDSPSARFDDRIRLFNEILVNLEMGYSVENLEYITLCLWYLLGSFRYIPQFREINKPQTQDTMQKVINFMKANTIRPHT